MGLPLDNVMDTRDKPGAKGSVAGSSTISGKPEDTKLVGLPGCCSSAKEGAQCKAIAKNRVDVLLPGMFQRIS
jgi:hypothetical protein